MNNMLDFIYMGQVELPGAWNKREIQNEKFMSAVEFEPTPSTPCLREQDKSSDIEQQPPFGDRK